MDAQALANQNATSQAQLAANQQAESMKIANDKQRHIWKMQEDDNFQSWAYMIAKLKVAQADAAVDKQAVTDILTAGMGQDAQPASQPAQ